MRPDSSSEANRPDLTSFCFPLPGEQLFPAILDNLDEPFFLLDDAARLVWHNKACNQLYHAVSGRDIDQSFELDELLTTDQHSLFLERFDRALGGEQLHFEWRCQLSGVKWLTVALYPFRCDNRNFTGVCGSLRDITEKKINELVWLRNTNVLNNIQEGVLLIDTDYTVLTFNRRAVELFGRLDQHIAVRTGMDFFKLLPEHRRVPVSQHLESVRRGIRVEYEVKHPSGLWLFINYLPVKDEEGNVRQISITFRDVTERKKAEDRIREKELKYRALVNSLSEGVILQTTDKQVLAVNKSAATILGLEVDELKEKGFPYPGWVLVDESEKLISHEGLFYKRNGRIHPVRNKILGIRRTNGIQWLKLNSAVVAQPQPQGPCALVVSFEDITEQKRISAEIEVLALLARETVNAVCILHPNGEMLWMNEGFTRLTGYAAEEMIGQTSRAMLTGPETDMAVVKRADHCRKNGLPFREEFVIYTKAGKKVWTRAQGQSVRLAQANAIRYFVIVTDISDEKKIEHQRLEYEIEQQKNITRVILQTRELERNELGRELHDNINQILAATRLQLSYCLNNFDDCEPVLRQCRENVIEAMEEIRRLSHKIVMPRFTERSLMQALKGLVENYRYAYRITLDIGEWKDEQAHVRVKEALYRIVQEQLSNIYKHARAAGVWIRLKQKENHAELAVEDDGVGFDPAEKKNGIGISNIHCRAESCGGVVELISSPGKGCTLVVRLPLMSGETGEDDAKKG
ncbi:PAS domain S-box protein [Puia dinghuensis]|uniref:Oxygen sensor histidine kinase NreB n=1 Tax=Puia dinghuensis TaxID=1792502 RepID=A0A8J2UDR0_9BACT|nr:PAS domain S-box protein [Puia dinghuensis]GGB03527.1 hypothetical protein GCM10011511_28540 [Puia dinghuensis]